MQAILDRPHDHAQTAAVATKICPVFVVTRLQPQRLQPVAHRFAAARRFGNDQAAAAEVLQPLLQRLVGFGERQQGQVAGIGGGAKLNLGMGQQRGGDLLWVAEQIRRLHQRPLQVTPVALKALVDLLPVQRQRSV